VRAIIARTAAAAAMMLDAFSRIALFYDPMRVRMCTSDSRDPNFERFIVLSAIVLVLAIRD